MIEGLPLPNSIRYVTPLTESDHPKPPPPTMPKTALNPEDNYAELLSNYLALRVNFIHGWDEQTNDTFLRQLENIARDLFVYHLDHGCNFFMQQYWYQAAEHWREQRLNARIEHASSYSNFRAPGDSTPESGA
jgi:hypothetical protein